MTLSEVRRWVMQDMCVQDGDVNRAITLTYNKMKEYKSKNKEEKPKNWWNK